MIYFLDTNIVSYALNDTFPKVKERILQTPVRSIVISSIVLSEIEYGYKKSKKYKELSTICGDFLSEFKVVPYDFQSAVVYGEIRSYLEKCGNLIGAMDMLIAAQVISNDGILVTHNIKDFNRIPNLNIEDWCV